MSTVYPTFEVLIGVKQSAFRRVMLSEENSVGVFGNSLTYRNTPAVPARCFMKKHDPNKHGEVTAESLIRLAKGHAWFQRDASVRASNAETPTDRLINKIVSRVHRETANVLRMEAKKTRSKP